MKPQKISEMEKDMERWPKSWAGFDADIPIGKEIVKVMRLFFMAMVAEQLSYTTINLHLNGLCLLGGEIKP
jgi:hypothetical protein